MLIYGDYVGTVKRVSVDTNGYLISSPVVRTQTSSKTSNASLIANTMFQLTADFDALSYTRLAGSIESDRSFMLFLNQGEDSPITTTLMYQTAYYPTLSRIYPTTANIRFQAETVIVVGTCSGSGTVTTTVTSATMTNSPKTITVNVLNNDTATTMAGKIRTALLADPDVSAYFLVGGIGQYLVINSIDAQPNDATMNLAIALGSAIGMTAVATSTHTQAGTSVKQVETATAAGTVTGSGNATVVITSAYMSNSPKTVSVAVTNTDTAATWAGKVRTALLLDPDVLSVFDVSGATTAIILTAAEYLPNDATLNISLANGTSTGITAAPTSANTTAGVEGSVYKYICAFDQELVHRYAGVWIMPSTVAPARFRFGLFSTSVVR